MPSGTKSKIIELLKEKEMTLTELSGTLNLAPSTINQHIKELLAIGAIRQIPNEFIVKQKYYEVNPDYMARRRAIGQRAPGYNGLSSPSFKIAAGIVLAMVIVGLLYEFGIGTSQPGSGLGAQAPSSSAIFSISDAPTVSTIKAVNVTINSVEVHSTSTGKWYTVLNTPKSFDLVMLRNISAALGVANIPTGNYDEFVLDVSNVSAVVNNASVGVLVPSSKLKIFGNFSVAENPGNSTSWINIDVNLARSLHMTGNGRMILLPVLELNAYNGTSLSIAANGIITVRAHGRAEAEISVSMGADGNFTNSTAAQIQAGENLNVSSDGKIMAVPGSESAIAIRDREKLTFITNVSNAESVIQNLSSQINTSRSLRGLSVAAARLVCNSGGRLVDCETSGDATVNITAAPIIGPCPYMCKLGSPCPPCRVVPPNSINMTNAIENTTTNSSVVVNASNPSNLPKEVNSSFASCQASSQCILVPIYPCQNLPQQSACINSANSMQYYQWYNGVYGSYGIYGNTLVTAGANVTRGGISTGIGGESVTNATASAGSTMPSVFACPLYLIAYQSRACGCSSNDVCTLYLNR